MRTSAIFLFVLLLLPVLASAAPGEQWEITSTTEMTGMPVPPQTSTSTVCVPGNSANDPRSAMPQDQNCTISDVKISGSTTSWKMRCNEHGTSISGTGEMTNHGSSYDGKMQMSGRVEGQNVNMNQRIHGKRMGGACDADQPRQQLEQQANAMCDVGQYGTAQLISMPSMFMGSNPTCPGKQQEACSRVRAEAAKDAAIFQQIKGMEQVRSPATGSVVSSCNLNMAQLQSSVCQANRDSSDMSFLEANCPAEAKAARDKLAAQRAYTAKRSYSAPVQQDDSAVDKALNRAGQLKSLLGF